MSRKTLWFNTVELPGLNQEFYILLTPSGIRSFRPNQKSLRSIKSKSFRPIQELLRSKQKLLHSMI